MEASSLLQAHSHLCTLSALSAVSCALYLPFDMLRRTLVPMSVVSVWRIIMRTIGSKVVLEATLQRVAVAVPPGLHLKYLATVTAPFLNIIHVTPKWAKSGVLLAMPYVGEVDLNLNSDASNVAITGVGDGFVVRGTVSLWAASPGDCSYSQHTTGVVKMCCCVACSFHLCAFLSRTSECYSLTCCL